MHSVSLLLSLVAVLAAGEPVRVACVGDSITFGQGVSPRDARDRLSYPAQLQAQLGDGYQVRNFGRPSATATRVSVLPYHKQTECAAALEFKPQVVVLMLGTNDARHWKRCATAFAADYRTLVRTFAELETKPRIILALPPPVLPNPKDPPPLAKDAMARTLAEHVSPQIRAAAEELRLPLVDFPALIQIDRSLMGDGVHPNQQVYAAMARLLAPPVRGEAVPTPESAPPKPPSARVP